MASPSRSFVPVVLVVALAATAGCRERRAADPARASARGGAIVSSIRAEPRTFNRYAARDSTTDTIGVLTQARLVRVNRVTQDTEPWLAESWTVSDDHLTYRLKLRDGVRFSDGTPFTADDVVFSFRAAYDQAASGGGIGETLHVNGKPLRVVAADGNTVVVTFPSAFGPGIRLLDNLPILPRHRLGAALEQGTFASAWGVSTPPSEICGLGPFVVTEYQPGRRLIFDRNPHYWRTDATGVRLPYLDRITLEVVPDQNAELLRLETGQIDCTQSEVRAEDYASLKRAEQAGRVRVFDLGVGLDADSLWFNLKPPAHPDPRQPWLQSGALREAVSYAVDRSAFAETVFFGAGVPVFGPVSPANAVWHAGGIARDAYDPARAERVLAAIGLADRTGDTVLEDRAGRPARFAILTQKGNTALERGAAVIRESLAAVGLSVDVVGLEVGALIDRLERADYDALYFRFLTTDLDPALNPDFWLSSGGAHVWNRSQARPATEWERRVDALMAEQAATVDLARRKAIFETVQAIFAEERPILYFAAPRVFVATSTRLRNATPALLRPMILWNADTLAVAPEAAGR